MVAETQARENRIFGNIGRRRIIKSCRISFERGLEQMKLIIFVLLGLVIWLHGIYTALYIMGRIEGGE